MQAWTYAGLDPEDPTNKDKLTILEWYYCDFLTCAAGNEYWGNKVWPHKIPVDTTKILGKEKVLVTIASETFALVAWENCWEKWYKMWQLKDKDPKWRKSQKKGECEEFDGKWTSQHKGRVGLCSWDKESFQAFKEYKAHVKNFRAVQEGLNGDQKNSAMIAAKEYACQARGMTADGKKKAAVAAEPAVAAVIDIDDE
jgi:hypothetical protein